MFVPVPSLLCSQGVVDQTRGILNWVSDACPDNYHPSVRVIRVIRVIKGDKGDFILSSVGPAYMISSASGLTYPRESSQCDAPANSCCSCHNNNSVTLSLHCCAAIACMAALCTKHLQSTCLGSKDVSLRYWFRHDCRPIPQRSS
jgi:hypothetical protein